MITVFEKNVHILGKTLDIVVGLQKPALFLDYIGQYMHSAMQSAFPHLLTQYPNAETFVTEKAGEFLLDNFIGTFRDNYAFLPETHNRAAFEILPFAQPSGYERQKSTKTDCHITINADKLVADWLNVEYNKNSDNPDAEKIAGHVLSRASMAGKIHVSVRDFLRSELNVHIFKEGQKRELGEKPDPYNLQAHAIRMLTLFKNTPHLEYAPAQAFAKIATDMKSSEDYGHFLGFFIGCNFLHKNYPHRYASLKVCDKDGGNLPLEDADFGRLMQNHRRPLLFKNLPSDLIDEIVYHIRYLKPGRFIKEYQKIAKKLEIPKEHWLAKLPPWLSKAGYTFSS